MKPLKNKKQGQQLAFLPFIDVEPLAECLVAFANGSGGLIVLGLDSNGRFIDEIYPEDVEQVLPQAMSLCQPPVIGHWQDIPTAQGTLIGIRVDRSDDLHSLEDGRVLVRSGDNNRALSGTEITELAATHTQGDYEEEVVPGATVDDFDDEIIQEYLQKREERGASQTQSRMELLFEIGAITSDGLPTVCGILLFGKNPQTFFPQCGAVFVRFPSHEPRNESGGAGYGR